MGGVTSGMSRQAFFTDWEQQAAAVGHLPPPGGSAHPTWTPSNRLMFIWTEQRVPDGMDFLAVAPGLTFLWAPCRPRSDELIGARFFVLNPVSSHPPRPPHPPPRTSRNPQPALIPPSRITKTSGGPRGGASR